MAAFLSKDERKMLGLKAARDRVLLKVTRYNAEIRVLNEKIRAKKRKEARAEMKKEREKKASGGRASSVERAATRGRPALYAGQCVACVYRAARKPGGPMHNPEFCKKLMGQ